MVAELSQHQRTEPVRNPAETCERAMVPPLFAPCAKSPQRSVPELLNPDDAFEQPRP